MKEIPTSATAENRAIGREVKRAIRASGSNTKEAAASAGIPYRTVLRYITGEREMPVRVLLALVRAACVDLPPLAYRLAGISGASDVVRLAPEMMRDPGVPSSEGLVSEESARRLSLVLSSHGLDSHKIQARISAALLERGVRFSRTDWGLLLDEQVTPRAEVLFAAADILEIDPAYFTEDDPAVVSRVEAELEFDRTMRAIGVNRVAARSLAQIEPGELRAVTEAVRDIVEELRSH